MHQHLQEHTSDSDEECCPNRRSEAKSNSSKSNKKVDFSSNKVDSSVWSGFQFHQIDTECHEEFCFTETDNKVNIKVNMMDYLWIDCGSTLKCTLGNPNLATDIRMSDKPIGMSTNAGTKKLLMQGNLPGHCDNGEAWIDPSHVTNLLGFSHMADDYHIQYDNAKEDSFIVHTPQGVVKFERIGRLCGYKPNQNTLKLCHGKRIWPKWRIQMMKVFHHHH